eukprot:scaffold24175_cov125-Isochrysis_galbana.AAC.6
MAASGPGGRGFGAHLDRTRSMSDVTDGDSFIEPARAWSSYRSSMDGAPDRLLVAARGALRPLHGVNCGGGMPLCGALPLLEAMSVEEAARTSAARLSSLEPGCTLSARCDSSAASDCCIESERSRPSSEITDAESCSGSARSPLACGPPTARAWIWMVGAALRCCRQPGSVPGAGPLAAEPGCASSRETAAAAAWPHRCRPRGGAYPSLGPAGRPPPAAAPGADQRPAPAGRPDRGRAWLGCRCRRPGLHCWQQRQRGPSLRQSCPPRLSRRLRPSREPGSCRPAPSAAACEPTWARPSCWAAHRSP